MRPSVGGMRPPVDGMRPPVDAFVRAGIRAVGWAVLAIAGILAFWMAAWVPPELAAMLGSRFSQSRTDPATMPAPGPPAARVSRRGTPRTTRVGAGRQHGRGRRTVA
jgi:hypothetical protein